MNDTPRSEDQVADSDREEMLSARFAGLVMQQTNLALMLLGRVPSPETGKTVRDLESAKMFIDQLEMLEAKTRGNLDPQEEKLLGQSLTALRMAFVEAVGEPAAAPASEPLKAAEPAPPSETAPATSPEDESRKKFSKKY